MNGFRVIAFDNRGRTAGEKLYDPEAYTGPIMADDARRLLDHLGIERADVLGYSMGARIAAFLGLAHPGRVQSAIFAGTRRKHGLRRRRPQAGCSRAPCRDPSTIADSNARAFRIFADQTKSDRRALAACIMASRDRIPGHEIATFRRPVLVAVGAEDTVAGSAKNWPTPYLELKHWLFQAAII